MDWKLKKITLVLLGIFVMGLSGTINAQNGDINDAKRSIKKGDMKKRADEYPAAIEAFNECINISSALTSEEAKQLKKDAEKKLVKSHLDYANELLKSDDYDQSLTQYEKSIELAEKYNQEDYLAKAKKNVPKVYYAKGKSFISDKLYKEAIKNFDEAIQRDPDYGWAYVRKAQSYMQLKQSDKMIETVDKAMEVGKKNESEKVVNTAKQIAYKYFAGNGIEALKAKNYEQAAKDLQNAVNYNGSPKIKHYLALSYGQIEKYPDAIKYENQAIEAMKDEPKEELAQYYFQLAQYYHKSGDKAKACEAYKNAAYGDYKENAEYMIKHKLKCQ